jgi:tellurite resistance protein
MTKRTRKMTWTTMTLTITKRLSNDKIHALLALRLAVLVAVDGGPGCYLLSRYRRAGYRS